MSRMLACLLDGARLPFKDVRFSQRSSLRPDTIFLGYLLPGVTECARFYEEEDSEPSVIFCTGWGGHWSGEFYVQSTLSDQA